MKFFFYALSITIFYVAFYNLLLDYTFADDLQERIPWNENRSLQWSDFKGIAGLFPDDFIEREYHASAFTRTWIEANWYFEKTDSPSCEYKITKIDTINYFLPYESWKRHDTQLTSYLLKHEQGHFDIAEIHTKKFNTLKNQKFSCPDGIYDVDKINYDLSKKFQLNLKELNEMDLRYDKETNGSLDKEKQQVWNDKIKSLLSSSETKSLSSKSKPSDCKGIKLCITGKVTKIVDGDTMDIKNYRIRLSLTDAPEKNDKKGFEKATAFTTKLCPVNSIITVDQDDKQPFDNHTRLLGKVTCSGKVLNSELLYNGHAKISTKFCKKSEFSNEPWAKKFGCK